MRTKTASLGIVALLVGATAGCAGASAVDGPVPSEKTEGQLPRVADDPQPGRNSPSMTSAVTEAPDRAKTVVPAPPRPGRGNLADDPYLPPRAVIPADPATPVAPPSSSAPATPTAPTTPPDDGAGEETTRPTLPTPQRPKPVLPPDIGGPGLPDFSPGSKPDDANTTDGTDGGGDAAIQTSPKPESPKTESPKTESPKTEAPTTEQGTGTTPDSGARL